MKQRVIKIVLIVVSTLAIIILALALVISPIAKNYIERHSKELIGRKVTMQDLHLNIFNGKMEVDAFKMYEANDRDLFASIDTFAINMSLYKLISSKIEITQVKVIVPYAEILQKGDSFNFDDLKPKKDTTKVKKSKSSFPKSIILKNIYIRGGKLVYKDLLLENTIRMNDMGVSIPKLTFEQGSTLAGINLKINNDATLNSKLALNMRTSEYRLNLQIKRLPIDIITPYVKAYYNIGKLEGLANGDLLITGNSKHIMDFTIQGTGSATGFSMTNNLGEPVASAKNADAKIDKIYMPKSTYLFDFIHASDVNLSFILKPKTNNVTVLFKPADKNAVASTTSEPMTVKIKDLHITNSQLAYTDKTLRTPFSLPIKKIDFQSSNFDMNGTNEFKVKAAFPEGGNMRFSWKGSMNDLSNQQIMINMQNLSLRLFSPYCLEYTAFDITKGNLNFISKNNILNNNIVSTNMLDVYKMQVGNKHKDWKAEYKVPLKLALYILKDKDEKIKFDVPVKGSIKDPQFSYRKIIFKTLVNLMVKVAVSPVRFLANTLGLKSDKLEEIDIEPLQTGLTAQQYSQLNDLARIVKSKPEMTLMLTQYVNLKEELPLYAIYKTKMDFLKSINKNDNKVFFTYDEVQAVKNNDKSFLEYLDNLVKSQGKVTTDASFQEKVNSLYVPDSLKTDLQGKMERRNEHLKNYLITTGEVPMKNLMIKTADKATLDAYDKRAVYKLDMSLLGAENPDVK